MNTEDYANSEVTPSLYAMQGEPFQVLCAALVDAGADGLSWHPFVPTGRFRGHQTVGEFEVTAADLQQMIDNFNRGLPFGAGIPIDENGLHQVRGEGAYGWIEALEIRGSTLWGGIRWTEDGRAAVDSKKFKYVSPHFFVGEYPNQAWMPAQGSLLFSAALCTRPFFREQPELQIAAAQCFPVTAAVPEPQPEEQQAPDIPLEVSHMTEAQAREQYEATLGPIEDAAWAELAEGVTDWEAFVGTIGTAEETTEETVAETETETTSEETTAEETTDEADAETPEARIARLEADIVARDAQLAEAVAARETAQTELAASQAQAREATLRGEIAATQFGDGLPTPASVEMLLPVRMNPTAENTQALYDYLRENGGMLPTYLPGEGVAASATGADGNDGEAWLDAKTISDQTKARTREIAATNGGDYRAAYKAVCMQINQGH